MFRQFHNTMFTRKKSNTVREHVFYALNISGLHNTKEADPRPKMSANLP